MSTTTMNISLPVSLKEYVRRRVSEERHSTPSDYVRSLIREDQKRHLEQLLLEGVRSGRGVEIGSKEWDKFWDRIYTRLQEKTKANI